MFSEDELLPVSGLQHLVFCERQWGLIHLENMWQENRLTAEGRVLHERAHEASVEQRGPVRIVRGLALHSLRVGLVGKADVVEFTRADPGESGCALPGLDGSWQPVPVEYKRGRPKKDHSDLVQLCAQALCLEEMLQTPVPRGALYYGKTARRVEAVFDAALRAETEALAQRMHALFQAGQTPPGQYEKKCDNCSLVNICRPKTVYRGHSARRYLDRALTAVLNAEEGDGEATP